MSSHLSILSNAGYVTSKRRGRFIVYAIDLVGTRALLAYLLEDCCRGQPELCMPVLSNLLPEQSVCD